MLTISLVTANIYASDKTPKTVSQNEVDSFIEQIQRTVKTPPAPNGKWVQPENKKEACKLFSNVGSDAVEAQKIIWDGACKDGYAYGLGREFFVRSQADDTDGWIAYYPGAARSPTYYAVSKFAQQIYVFGAPDTGLLLIGNAHLDGGYQTLALISASRVFYRRLLVATGSVKTEQVYPTGYTIMSEVRTDPALGVASQMVVMKDGVEHGYAIAKRRQGALVQVQFFAGNVEEVALPSGYTDFLNRAIAEANQRLPEADKIAGEGFRKMLEYRARLCATPTSDGEEPMHYRDICGAFGDLTSVYPELVKAKQSRDAKHEANAAELTPPALRANELKAAQYRAARVNEVTLSATVNSLLEQLGHQAPLRYAPVENIQIQPADQPYCYDPAEPTTCVLAQ